MIFTIMRYDFTVSAVQKSDCPQVTHYKPILNGTASLLALQINQLVNDMINS